jgi:hypothetical protein
MKQTIFILIVLISSCSTQTVSLPIKQDSVIEKSTYQPDSLEQAYMEGKYYYHCFIRLDPNEFAFIFIDSEYVSSSIKSLKARQLYFQNDILLPETREAYYKTMISAMPKEHLEIHRLVWGIKEVRETGKGSNGGFHTVATWLTGHPDEKDPFYNISLKRDYYDRFSTCLPIGYVQVNSKNHDITVLDLVSSENLPLEVWRKRQNEE